MNVIKYFISRKIDFMIEIIIELYDRKLAKISKRLGYIHVDNPFY